MTTSIWRLLAELEKSQRNDCGAASTPHLAPVQRSTGQGYRWYPLSSGCPTGPSNIGTPARTASADPDKPSANPASERFLLAKTRYEMWGCPPTWQLMRYAGHDVSNEPRDEDGKWTEAGGGSESEKSGSVITRRPSKSGVMTDAKGNAVGHFDFVSGWVTRAIRIGEAPVEKAVASIDDVVRALNSAKPPVSTDDWNEWFVSKGHPVASTGPSAPGYVPMRPRDDLDALVPEGELNALSGYDSEGKPRFYQASMAGPYVCKLIAEVCEGLLEKYVGGKITGVAVNAAGKLVVRIAKRGKTIAVELSDRMIANVRRRVNSQASKGIRGAQQFKAYIAANIPKGKYRGGRHGTMRTPVGDGLQSHHIPAKSVNGLPIIDGPAIQMDPADHAQTMSNGSSSKSVAHRLLQEKLIQQGKFGEAIQMDIDDIRNRFPDGKYEEAIQEMIDGLETWMKKGLRE